MDVIKILSKIQTELKAPKGQFNKFGKYKYRNCEDILEAVKPLLDEHGAAIMVGDELVQIGDRYYVKATAKLLISGASDAIINTAYAREAETKKGMDESQVTGSASSYARKYALNGLLAIDDTKDADTMDNRGQISGEKIDLDRVNRAAKYIKEQIDEDDPDHAPANIQKAWGKLSNDERLKVQELLGDKAKDSNRMYKTLLKDYLNAETNNE